MVDDGAEEAQAARRLLMQHARHGERERRNRGVERAAVLGDHLVGAAHRPDGRGEMRAARVDWQLVKYSGAVHSFTDSDAGGASAES